MQVITGSAKGIKLRVPHKARPISDRAKTSIFDVIGPDVIDKRILDLYAGSGALGIEALSRGARSCTFVDSNKFAVKDIESNLEKTSLKDKAEVRNQRALKFLSDTPDESYDLVFADPPYEFYKGPGRLERIMDAVTRITPPGGALIVKHPWKLELPEVKNLKLADKRQFGSNGVSLWVHVQT